MSTLKIFNYHSQYEPQQKELVIFFKIQKLINFVHFYFVVSIQDENDSVQQTDFVPTLALLLGIPIPFSNLGSIIPELFNHCPWWDAAHSPIRQVTFFLISFSYLLFFVKAAFDWIN